MDYQRRKEEGPAAGPATDHTSPATAVAVVSIAIAADPNAVVVGSTIVVVGADVVEEVEEGLKAQTWRRQGLGRDRHICSWVPCTFLVLAELCLWFLRIFL